MEFENKTVIVTGGTKGIGRAAARRFCEEGALVVVVSRHEADCKAYVDELVEAGFRADWVAADLSRVAEVVRMVATVVEGHGAIDVLVNNAGVNRRKPALEYTEDDWNDLVDINLKGAFFCAVECAKNMVAHKSGAIVNVSSLQGSIVLAGRTIYAATKGGIQQFTKGLAGELAQSGIRVNAISPGFVRTPQVESVMADPQWIELITSRTPMGRFAEPAEIAELIVFLASARASYITGANIPIDGGWTAT